MRYFIEAAKGCILEYKRQGFGKTQSDGTDKKFLTIRALTIHGKYKGSHGINSRFHYCNHELVNKQDF